MFTTRVNDKIQLKYPDKNDAAPLFTLIQKEGARMSRWLPWVDAMDSVEEEAEFLRNSTEKMARGTLWVATILYEGQPCGMIDIHEISATHHHGEIGYWLAAAVEGKGIMSAALQKTIEIAFTELDLQRLGLLAEAKNVRSQKVALHAHFTQEGIMRKWRVFEDEYQDMVIFSLLKTEWPA